MPTLTLTLPRPHSGQRAVLASPARWRVACMGRRWGKSALAINRLVGPALEGYPVAYFSPTYGMLTEIWREFARVLRPVVRRANAQEHRMELVTGGVLDMWSLDTPDVARGRKYRRLAVDEAAMVPRLLETFNLVLRPTLADYTGDADFYSTPRGFNDFHTLYQRGQDAAEPDWASWQRPTSDNPFIPPSEITAMAAEMTSLQYSQEIRAEFVNLEGGLFRREWFGTPIARPADVAQWVRFWDVAVTTKATSDYTVGALVGQRADGSLVIADLVRGRWEWPQAEAVIAQTAVSDGRAVRIGVESVAFQMAGVQLLRRRPDLLGHTITAATPDKDKYARAMPWASRAEAGLVRLVAGAWNGAFLDEVSDFPQGPHDDQIDAVSGAVELLAARKEVRIL